MQTTSDATHVTSPAASARRATPLLLALLAVSTSCKGSGSAVTVPRGVPGLQLGMTIDEAAAAYTLEAREAPAVTIGQDLQKRLGPEWAPSEEIDYARRVAQVAGARFYVVTASNRTARGALPDGVSSAHAQFTHGVLYRLGLHYGADHVKRVGWRGVAAGYLAELGTPMSDKNASCVWQDERTEFALSKVGEIVNAFYTDRGLHREVRRVQAEVPRPMASAE